MANKALLLFLLFLTLSACSPSRRKDPNTVREIVDMLGNRVTVPKPLERVALFSGPTGQIALILRADKHLCAVTNTFKLSPLVREFFPHITALPSPRTVNGMINIEELVASRAQLLIAGKVDGELVQRKTSIPVAFFEDSLDEGPEAIIQEIRFYAHIFRAEPRAEAYVRYLKTTETLISSRLKSLEKSQRLRVYNGFAPSHLVTLGGDTFFSKNIERAGCIDSASSIKTLGKREGLHSGLGEVPMEQVLAWNPDIIVVDTGNPEALKADPRWSSLKAVQAGKVYTIPSGFFVWNRPTAEAAALYPLWLAMTAYPEKFKDLSLPAILKEFYRTVFSVSLRDEQIGMILSGAYREKMMRNVP